MGSEELAVLVRSPVGLTLILTNKMTKLLLILVLTPCCFGARRLRGNARQAVQETRDHSWEHSLSVKKVEIMESMVIMVTMKLMHLVKPLRVEVSDRAMMM